MIQPAGTASYVDRAQQHYGTTDIGSGASLPIKTDSPWFAAMPRNQLKEMLTQSLAAKGADVVVVSGSKINPFDHMLLHIDGNYFHIPDMFPNQPQHLTESDFRAYLQKEKKSVKSTTHYDIPYPAVGANRLDALLRKKWVHKLFADNCVSFVEDVLKNAGAQARSLTNIPRFEPTLRGLFDRPASSPYIAPEQRPESWERPLWAE